MPTIPELPAASATTDESELAIIYKNGTTYKAVLADILALRQRANAILDSLSGLGAGVGFLQKTGPTTFVTTYIPGAGAYDPLGTAQAINDAHNLNASAHAAAGFAKLGAIQTFTEEQTFSKHVWISLGVTSDYSWMVANGTINNYFQAQTKNLSNAANASSDHVCTADTGTETLRYIDMGINNSGYTGGVMGAALDGYLYTSDDNLNLGAIAASKVVRVLAGGSNVATNTVLSIASTGVTEYGSLRVVATQANTTQDAIVLAGRAGGTSNYAVTLTPPTLAGNITVTLPSVSCPLAAFTVGQTWTAAQTFQAANAIRVEAASTQDAIILAGRVGGSGSYAATIVPGTLTGSVALTLPVISTTLAGIGAAHTWTAAQTFRAANSVRVEAAASQDAIVLAGRVGGSTSYAVTLTPAPLGGNQTVTIPNETFTIPSPSVGQTWTAAHTFRAASAIRVEAAATQDAIVLAGRAGGVATYAVTLTPPTLAGNVTVTLPTVACSLAGFNVGQTWTAAQTFRAANAIRSEAAVTQDAIVLAGRAGGTSSYAVTLAPTTLTANRTLTLPNADVTLPSTFVALSDANIWTAQQTVRAATGIQIGTNATADAIRIQGSGYNASGNVLTLSSNSLPGNVTQTFLGGNGSIPLYVLVPAGPSAPGIEGQIAFDATYAYFCYAVNTWRRVAIATW